MENDEDEHWLNNDWHNGLTHSERNQKLLDKWASFKSNPPKPRRIGKKRKTDAQKYKELLEKISAAPAPKPNAFLSRQDIEDYNQDRLIARWLKGREDIEHFEFTGSTKGGGPNATANRWLRHRTLSDPVVFNLIEQSRSTDL